MLLVMADNTQRDTAIRARYYAGASAIELGTEYGLSRSQVHRIVAAGPPAEADDYDGDEAVFDTSPEPTPPFTFVGMETVLVTLPGDDHPTAQECQRWLDANGKPCNELHLYRAVQAPVEFGDYERSDAIAAQIDAERVRYRQQFGA